MKLVFVATYHVNGLFVETVTEMVLCHCLVHTQTQSGQK